MAAVYDAHVQPGLGLLESVFCTSETALPGPSFTMSLRSVFVCCVLALLAAPAMALPVAAAPCVPKGGPYTKDCKGKCCSKLSCTFTTVGGGYYCE